MNKLIICLDAGHGGNDPGASFGGIKEKDVVLQIALKMRNILILNKFVDPIMTRDSDVFVTLDDRVKIANDSKADYFLSLHVNAAGVAGAATTASGEEIWVMGNDVVSRDYASLLIDFLDMSFPGQPHRGIKSRAFHVLKYTKMPSALVEFGFINHPESHKVFSNFQDTNRMALCLGLGLFTVAHAIYKKS
jgi:N-acetylmuramoyl-L-alanine amidase